MLSVRLLAPFLLIVSVFGQIAFGQISAPPQPTTGPGGSDYLYDSAQSGPYNAQGGTGTPSYIYYIFTPNGMAPTPTNPNPLPTPSTAPVVLFLHGYDGNTLAPYLLWMEHMAMMGSTVVWVLFDDAPVADWDKLIAADWNSALALLEAPTPMLIPPTMTPAGKPMTFIVGHSAGAYMALKVANETTTLGIPVPLGVLNVEPGEGQIPAFTPTTVASTTVVATVIGDEDNESRLCLAPAQWAQMSQIPASQKPFLIVRTDELGVPAQLGNHWFPLTDTEKDDVPPPVSVDNRDWNVTYKLSVAMVRCIHDGAYCDYLYGTGPANQYGSNTETFMGVWSNGTPVLPMLNVADPPGYYGNSCKGLK